MIEIAGGIQYCLCALGRQKKAEWLALPEVLIPLIDRYGKPMFDPPVNRRARSYYEQLAPTLPDAEDLEGDWSGQPSQDFNQVAEQECPCTEAKRAQSGLTTGSVPSSGENK